MQTRVHGQSLPETFQRQLGKEVLKQAEFGKSVSFLQKSWELMNLGYAHFTSL